MAGGRSLRGSTAVIAVALSLLLVFASCTHRGKEGSVAYEDVNAATNTALDYYRMNGTWIVFAAYLPDHGDPSVRVVRPNVKESGVSVFDESESGATIVARDAEGYYQCNVIRANPWRESSGDGWGYPESSADCANVMPETNMDMSVASGDLQEGQMIALEYGRQHRGFKGLGDAIAAGSIDSSAWPAPWSRLGPDAPPHHVVVVEEHALEATIAVKTDDGRFVCLTMRRDPPGFKHFGQGTGFPASTADCLATSSSRN